MNTAQRIGISLAILIVPLVVGWITFGWDSSLSKGLTFIMAGTIIWTLARLTNPTWRRRR